MNKRILSGLIICLTMILLQITAGAYYITGTCGKNVEWGFDISSLQLDIWGTGDMDDIDVEDRWGEMSAGLKIVKIESGVTSVGNCAFFGCPILTTVELPDTLLSIGDYAFSKCEKLEEINIPEGTKRIGDLVFDGTNISDIYIPSTITDMGAGALLTKDGANIHISDIAAWCNIKRDNTNFQNYNVSLYWNDTPLTSVTIPDGVTQITDYAFYGFSNVKTVTVPASVKSIGQRAFSKNIILNVYENSAAHKYAIENSIPYNIITYPDTAGNEIIISGSQANGNTINITAALSSKEAIQGNVLAAVYDMDGTLSYMKTCPAADSVDISVEKRDNDSEIKLFWWFDTNSIYPMADCARIDISDIQKEYSINKDYNEMQGSVKITTGEKEVSSAAEGSQIAIDVLPYSGYTVLETVVTDSDGNRVEVVNNTFVMPNCSVTVSVVFAGIVDSGICGINDALTWVLDSNGTLTISGSGQMQDFSSDNMPWRNYSDDIKIVVVGDGVTRISKNAFKDFSRIKRVLINKSVKEIEVDAFKGCTDLRKVEYGGTKQEWDELYIGSGNEQIQNAEPTYNSDLSQTAQTDLDYLTYKKQEDNTVTIIGCFPDAAKINIPNQIDGLPVTVIGENAFSGCADLTEIHIPSSVTDIGDYAFSSSALKEIIIPDCVKNIGVGVFSGCDEIITAGIGNGVTAISELAFFGCGSLESVALSDSVKEIGGEAFYDCSSLSDIIIPDSVAVIGDSAFSGCASLTGITIPADVTDIGNGAFSGCNSLTDIDINGSSVRIGDSAFASCSSLTSVNIGGEITSIGKDAFSYCTNIKDVYITDIVKWCRIEFAEAASNPMCYAKNIYVDNVLVTDLVIPNKVTRVNNYAFYSCDGLTGVTIPDSVTSIGDNTFEGCVGLTSIILGKGIANIGADAFENCINLDSVYISDMPAYLNTNFISDYSNPMYYADKLYLNNKRITSVEIPNGVVQIPAYAFNGCDSITDVTISDGVTGIGDSAFSGCNSIADLTIPKSITSIGSNAFSNCSGLNSITIDGNLTYSSGNLFTGCTELTDVYVCDYKTIAILASGTDEELITNCTLHLNNRILNNWGTCGKTVAWFFDDKTTLIISGEGAMNNYSSYHAPWYSDGETIENVIIEAGVARIGDYAFENCSGLTDFYYERSYKELAKCEIGKNNDFLLNSMLHCDDLTVNIWGTCGNTSAWFLDDQGTLTIGGEGNMNDYSYSSVPWYSNRSIIKAAIIEQGVTSIGNNAFYGSGGLTSVTIPDSITSLGNNAFYDCSGLTSVTIPDNVTSIGSSAFVGCDSLNTINYNATSCTSIGGKGSFIGCASLTTINIGANVKVIPQYAFAGCSGLTSVTIPDSITSIGSSAFDGCSSLNTINYNAISCTSIGNGGAFVGCASLTTINIGANVKVIPQYAFDGCSSLTEISIPDSITSIGGDAFRNCGGLTEISIPDSVTSIGGDAFYGCNNLQAVYITDIAKWCEIDFGSRYSNPMYYADNLYINDVLTTDLVIPNGVIGIGNYVFSGCSGLTSITIPDSVTSIGGDAFYGCNNLQAVYITDIAKWCEIDFGVTNNRIASNPFYYAEYMYVNDVLTTDLVIPNGVTSIGYYAFVSCNSLTSVTIPNSVTSIGDYAFSNCSRLTSITIPNSVTSIGGYAFRNCGGLTEITIPNSVTNIGDYAFYNCNNLKTVRYCGNSDKWNDMYIGRGNDYLKNADIEYNYVME